MRIQFVSILCTQQSARVQGHRINYTIQKKKKGENKSSTIICTITSQSSNTDNTGRDNTTV